MSNLFQCFDGIGQRFLSNLCFVFDQFVEGSSHWSPRIAFFGLFLRSTSRSPLSDKKEIQFNFCFLVFNFGSGIWSTILFLYE